MVRNYSSVAAVFPLQKYTITDVDTAADEFVVDGDQRERFLVGDTFVVIDSTGNDGTYTVATALFDGTETTIGVNEDITDATINGDVVHDEVADELGITRSHDNTTDRDAETPDQIAGAHIQRLTNEIRALGRTLGTGIGFAILDGGDLDILYSSGTIIFGSGAPIDGVPGKLTLADDDISYVEVDSAAVVSANVVSFTVGKYPLAIVTTASGAITDIENKRSAIYIAELAELVHALGGALHSPDTLSNLNSKLTDAVLDDSGDPRDPNAHVHNADDVNAGTFANARIAVGNITQHVASIDHDALLNYLIAQHRIINDAGSSTTELYSASKIASEIAAVVAGVDHKDPVATSTEGLGDIALSGEQTLNGVLTSASRVLVTEQTLPAQNGIYISNGSGWSRSPDADTDAEVTNGLTVWVGDSGSDVYRHHYLLTTADPITVGTTPLTFAAIPDMEFGTTAGTATEGNDSRVPTQDENDALVGTNGTPSSANKYVTNTDPRNSNARTPVAHAIAGAQHSADTLANLNGLISDATLIGAANLFQKTGEAGGAARTLGNTDSYSLGFLTNNVTRIFIAAGGDISIGHTGAPNERLDIRGTNPRIYLADAAAPGTTTNRLYSVAGVLYWNAVNLTAGGGGDFSNGGEAGGADRTLGNTDNFDMGFLTNNVSRLHIQNDGLIGIGTTSPKAGHIVDIVGSPSTETQLRISDNAGAEINIGGNGNTADIIFKKNQTGTKRWGVGMADGGAGITDDLVFIRWTGASFVEDMRLTDAGNLGIGTSTPGSDRLFVAGSAHILTGADPAVIIESNTGHSRLNIDASATTTYPNIGLLHAGTKYWDIGSDGAFSQNWYVHSTQKSGGGDYGLVITKECLVGMGGVTSPAAKLHIDQNGTTAAIPVLTLDQADVSEEMIEFISTIGIGNAIEAVGAKTLTTTHFIKVTLPGALTRYIPVGTIA